MSLRSSLRLGGPAHNGDSLVFAFTSTRGA